MLDQTEQIDGPFRRLPGISRPLAVVALAGIWLLLLVHDIVTGTWRTVPVDRSLLVILLPLLGLIPALLRTLRLPALETEQAAFKTFRDLTVGSIVVTTLFVMLGFVPISTTDTGLPASLASFLFGRLIALIAVIALSWLIEPLVRIFRFRTHGSISRLSTMFVVALFTLVALAQFTPLVSDDGRAEVLPILRALGGLVALAAQVIATRTGWIINLRKEQKWGVAGLAFAGLPVLSGMMALLMTNSNFETALVGFAPGLFEIYFTLVLSLIFTYIVVFISAILALPTAGTIDRRNIEVSSLTAFARLLTRSLDTNALIDTAITIARDATGANAAWIELREGDSIQIRLGSEPRISTRAARQLMTQPLGRELVIAQAVAQRRRVEVIDRLRRVALYKGEMRNELRSLAAAPLQLGDQLLGVLYVAKGQTHGFDRRSAILLGALADQIAMAIEQSHLIRTSLERERFEQEMLIARDLQERLLPKHMPQSPFYQIYAESLPASIVGGDYYDVVAFSDNTLGILVADVSGKGASAALYMGMIKGIVQALSGQCATPAQLLAKTNAALYGSIDNRWFATMTCAQIIDETRTLRVARAGHCPTLLIRDGVGAYSTPRGLGLAIARPSLFDKNLEIEELAFGPGDYAIFFSDGLPEARSPDGEEFGFEELMTATVTAAAGGGTPHDVREAIFERIDAFTRGEPLADDSTLVILRWC